METTKTQIPTCERHRHLRRRLQADLEGYLLKHPEATNVVVCETR